MKKIYFLSLIALLLIGAFIWIKRNTTSQSPKTNPATIHALLSREVTIMLSKNGFSPKAITIKTDTAVLWKNTSGEKQTVNSDAYPTNQLHKELNFGVFANGSSVSYIFTKPGNYGYHNQFHPEQRGEIIVK